MLTSESKPTVCFVALNSYNVLAAKQDLRHVGGAEVQQAMIARWLAAKGYGVRFVTLDHGQREGADCSGITVHKAYDKAAGLPILRFFVPRWSGLCSALERARSDVYYQRGSGAETGQVALWCRMRGRRFVFGSASEADCVPELPFLASGREKVLYRLGLRLAHGVVAQTHAQQSLLLTHFGVKSAVVRNCAAEADGGGGEPPPQRVEPTVLWVGRIVPVKRFEWLLEVARQCPGVRFQVVGGVNQSSRYTAELIGRAGELGNVSFHGEVPHSRMDDFYAGARLLLCTSSWEGFPNTFLEAWRLGLPVVTSYDPDGCVRANGLGVVGTTVEELAGGLRLLLEDAAQHAQASRSSRAYFDSCHTPNAALPGFERILLRLIRPVGGAGGL